MDSKFTITAKSRPVYDDWGNADHWSANDWIKWHKELVTEFGKKQANKTWVAAYLDPTAPSFGAARAGWLLTSSLFIDYTKQNGLHESINTGVNGFVSDVGNKAVDAAQGAVDTAGNVAGNALSGLSNTSKLLKYGLPIMVIVLVAVGIAYAKNSLTA